MVAVKARNFKESFIKILLFPLAIVFSIWSVSFPLSVLIALFIPLYFYKSFITLLARCKMPGSKILGTQDNALAKSNVYLQRDQYIVVQMDLEGRMDFDDFLRLWEERVQTRKRTSDNGQDSSSEELMFPELKCYIETWAGYSFHREDTAFDSKNHIKLYKDMEGNSPRLDFKQVAKIKEKFMHDLFPVKTSPWQILIVHNYIKEDGKEYTVILNKAHHCLGDGYTGILVFWKCLFQQTMDGFTVPKAAMKPNLCTKLIVISSAAYDTFKIVFRKSFQLIYDRPTLFDSNSWHTTENLSDRVYCTMKPIKSSLIKEVSRAYNVTVTTVLLALASGALRRMMIAKGTETPENFRTVFSLPLPNHPEKLQTHASVTQFMLNAQSSSDQTRLNLIDGEMKKAVRMVLLFATQFGMFLFQSFPFSVKMFHKPSKIGGSTFFIATIPVPKPSTPDLIFQGCRLDAFYSTCEIIIYNMTASVNIAKYKDSFFFNYGIQKHLLKDEDEIYEIEKYVLEELHHLRTSIIV